MTEFKEGDLVLCKKDYYVVVLYEDECKYEVEEIMFKKGEICRISGFWEDQYKILQLEKNVGNSFYYENKESMIKEMKDDDEWDEDDGYEITNHFDDFFYNKSELRKLKLNKLDNTN